MHDVPTLLSAEIVGIPAMARRRLEQRLLDFGDEQRREIGADLHDGLGQLLTGIACKAAALRDQLRARHAEEAEQAGDITSLVNAAIDLTRATAQGLFPVEVEHDGLPAALESLASQVRRLNGVECRFECERSVKIGPQRAQQLYRIAQEAISNAIRHGAADHIVVRLETREAPLRLVVEDDGEGFDPRGRRNGGMGLRLMERRAASIGAEFKIARRPRGGMRVECVLGSS